MSWFWRWQFRSHATDMELRQVSSSQLQVLGGSMAFAFISIVCHNKFDAEPFQSKQICRTHFKGEYNVEYIAKHLGAHKGTDLRRHYHRRQGKLGQCTHNKCFPKATERYRHGKWTDIATRKNITDVEKCSDMHWYLQMMEWGQSSCMTKQVLWKEGLLERVWTWWKSCGQGLVDRGRVLQTGVFPIWVHPDWLF